MFPTVTYLSHSLASTMASRRGHLVFFFLLTLFSLAHSGFHYFSTVCELLTLGHYLPVTCVSAVIADERTEREHDGDRSAVLQ